MKNAAALSLTLTCLLAASPASALLTLTPAGAALGFDLSTFASGFQGNAGTVGPGGIAVNGLGQVLLDSTGNGRIFVFTDVDGQTPGSALSSTVYTGFPPGLTNSGGLGGAVFGSGGYSSPGFIKFTDSGAIANTFPVAGGGPTLGVATNPVNGHVFGTDGLRFYELDPSSGVTRAFGTSGGDGIAISFDGTKLYSSFGGIFSTTTGAPLGSWGSVAGADGIAFISSSNAALDGNLVVNSNNGTLVMIDVHNANAPTVLASGGSRGDYVSPDFTNGSLFVTQSDSVFRLSCSGECSVGTVLPAVPEPSTWLMMFAGLGALVGARRFRHI